MSTISAGVTVPTALNLSGDTTGALTFQVSGTVTAATISSSGNVSLAIGNLSFAGTGQRITGDMSNATHANRLSFQSSTTNGATTPFLLPNGTSQISGIVAANASDPTNCSFGQLCVNGTSSVDIISSILGTGTYLPMTFATGGSERMRLDTSGQLGLNVVPYAWGTASNRFIDINSSASCGAFGTTDAMMLSNAYWNGSNWVRKIANNAWRAVAESVSGAPSYSIQYAANSTAGSTITWSTALNIASNGNVGVGQGTPAARLDVLADSGNIVRFINSSVVGVSLSAGSNSFTTLSDERNKTDLVPISDAVSKLKELRTVVGRYNQDDVGVERSFLIAQDVQKVFPPAVDANKPDELGLRYTDMIPLLVAAINELKAENDALKARIEALESK